MARPKYQITGDDYFTAQKWLYGKLSKHQLEFKGEGDFLTAGSELKEIPLRQKITKQDVEALQMWCEKYLAEKAWKQMKTTIRAARMRSGQEYGEKKQITLSNQAWCMLSGIAEAERATLSQVVEKHLKKAYLKAIGTDETLQKNLL